ncbi:MAG: hypothetical protein IT437_13375 [Phycisphaerales bacterium]|nr:hypothetical protein [Phycisphaerales bacterium]
MTIDPISSPSLRLAQAYGVAARGPTRATVRRVDEPGTLARVEAVRPRGAGITAAVVPGRVDFSASDPAHDAGAIPMYRHPADRNAAATAIQAGRVIDVTA